MIDKYIEKDIYRKVKLAQYFFDIHVLRCSEVARKLEVSTRTIKSDCEKIRDLVSPLITKYECDASTVTIIFDNNLTRYELVKKIYKESRFLNVCTRYVNGDTNYLSIVEGEYVSVTKAFSIKKHVEDFFSETLGSNWQDNDNYSEIDYRLLLLSIYTRTDYLNYLLNDKYLNKAKFLAEKILSKFLNQLKDREFSLLMYTIYLSLSRGEQHKITISDTDKKFIKSGLIFKQIMEVINEDAQKYSDILDEDEIIFISVVYRTLSYNPPSYLLLDVDYKYQRERLIRNFKSIDMLLDLLEIEFKVPLRGNILFELPFFNLIYASKWKLNHFILDRSRFLNKEQLNIQKKIKKILNKWSCYNDGATPSFTDSNIDNFCMRISSLLMTGDYKNIIPVLIVAEDAHSHVSYREHLKKWLSDETIVIDDRLYYSLEEIPEYFYNQQSIIICERSLLNENFTNEEGIIFPITDTTFLEDIKNIMFSIYK